MFLGGIPRIKFCYRQILLWIRPWCTVHKFAYKGEQEDRIISFNVYESDGGPWQNWPVVAAGVA